MQNKGKNILDTFLELLKVKHTKAFTNRFFNEHPHKYNLPGLSKMWADYGVENGAVKIIEKEENISAIETPFIARFGGESVVVKLVDDDNAVPVAVAFHFAFAEYFRSISLVAACPQTGF